MEGIVLRKEQDRTAAASAATPQTPGQVWLDDGSGLRRCELRLDTGSAYVPVRLFLDNGRVMTEV